jgi:hypothetical protein
MHLQANDFGIPLVLTVAVTLAIEKHGSLC